MRPLCFPVPGMLTNILAVVLYADDQTRARKLVMVGDALFATEDRGEDDLTRA